MILANLTLWPLLFGAAPAHAPVEVTPTATTAVRGDYEELVAEYEKAVAEWKVAFDAAEIKVRRELRASHPAATMWARFEQTASAGEGRALMWMIQHTKDKGLKRAEATPVKVKLYGQIFENHLDAAWLGDAITAFSREGKAFGEDGLIRHLEALHGKLDKGMPKAIATVKLGEILSGTGDAEKVARGQKLLRDYEKTYIGVGAEALDFEASTIEGHDFKLSDYRGKVVLVDFYGFW